MATGHLSEVVQHLRGIVLRDGAGMTDGQLLACFVEQQDEAAFAALLQRHGSMVWGVCRRILSDRHDAEDAFQASFLILVRKAATVVPREKVGNWLYGVAYRTALKAKATAARRRARERQVNPLPEPEAAPQDGCGDLLPLLDQELSRLPDKYRLAVVLCDLQGKTCKEAARQLGCPEGTLAARRARARTMLARRLTRHGVSVSAGSLAATLAPPASSACPPAALTASTIVAATSFAAGQAAAGLVPVKVAALTEGVLKSMLLSRLKIATLVVLLVGVVGVGEARRLFFASSEAAPIPLPKPVKKSEVAQADQPFDGLTPQRIKALLAGKIAGKIDGGTGPTNQIPAGAVLVYRTSEGRYGKCKVIRLAYDLELKWVTYAVDGTAFSKGDKMVVRGTWKGDLDRGQQVGRGKGADFWWEQVNRQQRYLVPCNKAVLVVYRP